LNPQTPRARLSFRVLLLSLLAVLANVLGNYSLDLGVKGVAEGAGAVWLRYFREPGMWIGVALLIGWLLLRLALLSATDMSLVLPATAGVGYTLTSLVGQFWLHESVSATHNVGLAVIAAGVVLIGSTSRQ
jgi:undecaprenyl phosphate-alpha-L-ara4N flippase subunit ArnE